MTIAALITEGIGPGGSIKYVMTGGLDISATIPSIWTPVMPAAPSWAAVSPGATSWAAQSPAAASWTPVGGSNDIWTPVIPGTTTWTKQ